MQYRPGSKCLCHKSYLLLVIFAVRTKSTNYLVKINTGTLKVVFRSKVNLRDIIYILRGRLLISLLVGHP